MAITVTPHIRQVWLRHKATCVRNGIGPFTLMHRGERGSNAAGANPNNTIYSQSAPTTSDESTTNYTVWAVWKPAVIRGGSSDAADTAAGRSWSQRNMGQICILDTSGNQVTISDEDWLVAPDGTRFKIENPSISPDGAYYNFTAIRQGAG